MRRTAALLVLTMLTSSAVALAAPAGAAPGTSYRIRVLPDPTVDAWGHDSCGLADAWVLGTEVGGTAKSIKVPAGRTLTVQLTPDAQVFAGDEGTVWRLRLRVGQQVVARSAGPAWRAVVQHRATKTEQVWLLACNRSGYPDATVSYSIR